MKILIDENTHKLKKCIKFKDRLLGLMFKKNVNEYLLFENCNSIHTFFMLENIDILFLDKANNILRSVSRAKKWRIYMCRGAKKVIEMPKNTLKDKIKIVE